METTKKYGFFIFMISLQITTNVWGMDLPDGGDKDRSTQFEAYLESERKFTPQLFHPKKWPTDINHVEGYFEKVIKPKNDPVLTAAFQNAIVRSAKSIEPIFSLATARRTEEEFKSRQQSTDPIKKKVFENMKMDNYLKRIYVDRPLMTYTGNGSRVFCAVKDTKTNKYVYNQDGFQALAGVGTEHQEHPYTLSAVLDTEEINLASYYGIKISTPFINTGERGKCFNKMSEHGTYEPYGTLIGVVGACYEKPGYLDCLQLQDSNADIQITPANADARVDQRLYGKWFSPERYKDRISDPITNFLLTSATGPDRSAYAHVMGLGLGAWLLFKGQTQIKLMLEVYKEILSNPKYDFSAIDTIDFSWFNATEETQKEVGLVHGSTFNGIKILFTKRNISDPLIGNDKGKNLFIMVAWDGSAYFGNEFYNRIPGTSDPDSCFASLGASLANPQVNPYFEKNLEQAWKETELNLRLGETETEEEYSSILIEFKNYQEKRKRKTLKAIAAGKAFAEVMGNYLEMEKKAIAEKLAVAEKTQIEKLAAEKAAAEKQEQEVLEKRLALEKAEKKRLADEQAKAEQQAKNCGEKTEKAAREKALEQNDYMTELNDIIQTLDREISSKNNSRNEINTQKTDANFQKQINPAKEAETLEKKAAPEKQAKENAYQAKLNGIKSFFLLNTKVVGGFAAAVYAYMCYLNPQQLENHVSAATNYLEKLYNSFMSKFA